MWATTSPPNIREPRRVIRCCGLTKAGLASQRRSRTRPAPEGLLRADSRPEVVDRGGEQRHRRPAEDDRDRCRSNRSKAKAQSPARRGSSCAIPQPAGRWSHTCTAQSHRPVNVAKPETSAFDVLARRADLQPPPSRLRYGRRSGHTQPFEEQIGSVRSHHVESGSRALTGSISENSNIPMTGCAAARSPEPCASKASASWLTNQPEMFRRQSSGVLHSGPDGDRHRR